MLICSSVDTNGEFGRRPARDR
ncbi:hypothetical protein PL79_031115 [Burkholderia sp. USMB20]|nr:hypothetical protein PL79_031115 [Burkholderia sp. USMB20]